MRTPINNWYEKKRLGGLWRFAIALSIINILGHTVFGFEQAWAHPFVALATAYAMELSIEGIQSWAQRRQPRFLGSPRILVEFLLSAHISALAVSMLLYSNERFWVTAFATATAIASKTLFRAPVVVPHCPPEMWPQRHFLNPSNFGISIALLAFPWVGIAPPYQFTENLRGPLDVVLPLLIIMTGSFLNFRFTERIPLILAWLGCFFAQAVIRSWWNDVSVVPALLPMTGVAFILFTFYMVTDPGTTPSNRRSQIAFGAAVAAVYGILVANHVVFGLFFSLTLVCMLRGLTMLWSAWSEEAARQRTTIDAAASAEQLE
jgi:hypothetical protein